MDVETRDGLCNITFGGACPHKAVWRIWMDRSTDSDPNNGMGWAGFCDKHAGDRLWQHYKGATKRESMCEPVDDSEAATWN